MSTLWEGDAGLLGSVYRWRSEVSFHSFPTETATASMAFAAMEGLSLDSRIVVDLFEDGILDVIETVVGLITLALFSTWFLFFIIEA